MAFLGIVDMITRGLFALMGEKVLVIELCGTLGIESVALGHATTSQPHLEPVIPVVSTADPTRSNDVVSAAVENRGAWQTWERLDEGHKSAQHTARNTKGEQVSTTRSPDDATQTHPGRSCPCLDINYLYQKCLWRRVGLYATGMMSAGESQRPWWQPVRMSIEIRRTYERRWRRQKMSRKPP